MSSQGSARGAHRPDRRELNLSRPTGSGNLWRENSLSIVLVALFAASMAGQAFTGWREYNGEQRAHHSAAVTFPAYLGTGHFWEATGENWESEFLQMAMFVILTAVFR
jgi:hypothetical protein